MSYRHHRFGFFRHIFHQDTSFGRFLRAIFAKFFPQPEPEPIPDPVPEAPSVLDLSSLDALIGTAGDSVDQTVIQDTSGDDYTTLMFEQGMLVTITDGAGLITGFEFTAPDGVELSVTGTIGGDNITTDLGDNELNGRAGNDTLSAGEGNDTLHGGTGNDVLNGGAGDDMLYGDEGNDTLFGDADNDTLNGGQGTDNLFGGTGADTFVFSAADLGSGVDRVRDFDIAEGDVIDISDLLTAYDPLANALEDFVRITDNGTNSFVAVDVDGGGDSFQNVATVFNTTGLTDEQALVNDGTLIV